MTAPVLRPYLVQAIIEVKARSHQHAAQRAYQALHEDERGPHPFYATVQRQQGRCTTKTIWINHLGEPVGPPDADREEERA